MNYIPKRKREPKGKCPGSGCKPTLAAAITYGPGSYYKVGGVCPACGNRIPLTLVDGVIVRH